MKLRLVLNRGVVDALMFGSGCWSYGAARSASVISLNSAWMFGLCLCLLSAGLSSKMDFVFLPSVFGLRASALNPPLLGF